MSEFAQMFLTSDSLTSVVTEDFLKMRLQSIFLNLQICDQAEWTGVPEGCHLGLIIFPH